MIYTITAVSFFLLSIYLWREGSYEKTRLALALALVWRTLHDGLTWEIGTDWDPYYDFFRGASNTHFEPGYVLFNRIMSSIWDNYSFFLLCFAGFTYYILYRFLSLHAVHPLMALCLYYCEMMGSMGSNRSILAMFVCLVSLRYIFKRNLWGFVICIIVAMTFHLASIVFFPAYFLFQKEYGKKKILTILILAFIVNRCGIINRLPFVEYATLVDSATSTSGFASYVDDDSLNASMIGSLKRFLIVFWALQVRTVVNNKQYDFFVLLYSAGAFIFILFNGSVLQLMAGRGSMFYNIYAIVVIPYIIVNMPYKKDLQLFLWFVIFVFDFFIMWRDINSYALTIGLELFNPYKCVLFQ